MTAYFSLSTSLLPNPYCVLKDKRLVPSDEISRVYYLYTNETELYIDLSRSSYSISPLFNRFDTCYCIISSLTALAIGLIVVVSVLSLTTTILVAICLKKQLTKLYHIWKNWIDEKLGLTPPVFVDN